MSRNKTFWVGTFVILFAAYAWSDFTYKDSAGSTQTASLTTDGANATLGAKADAAWVSGSGSVIAILKNIANGVNAAIAAGTAMIGYVGLQANTTGGCTMYHLLSGATTNSTLISTGAHTICGYHILNTSATGVDFRIYDAVAAPTCSSGTGVVVNDPVAGNATSPGMAIPGGPFGGLISTGLGFCLTSSGGWTSDADNGNAVTGVAINVWYK